MTDLNIALDLVTETEHLAQKNHVKKKVVIFSQIFPEFEEKLRKDFDVIKINPKLGDVNQQIREAVTNAHGMIGAGRLLGKEQLETAQHLEIVSSVSVGYDNYDVDYLKSRQIQLAHTPHVLTETTADTAIGSAIARRGYYGFNMNIKYYGRREKLETAHQFQAEYLNLEQLLTSSDFVVVAVDLNAQTKHLLGQAEFALMKSTAVLVNISRGAVIDEDALIEVLQNQQIFGAGLDVFAHEPLQSSKLFELNNVVVTPHIGSATEATRYAMNKLAYENLVLALNGQKPKYSVV
jgi:gluconate 2-dehydrogenase